MIVGVCGLMNSGKSTAAKFLVETYDFERIRFAGPLKDMMRALGLEEREIEGDLKEQPCELLGGKTPRWAMQSIGTEWGRNLIDPDLWVRAWKKKALLAQNFGHDIVSDDVRFVNEAAIIKELGGTIVKIERPGLTAGSHASEAVPFVPDTIISNDGDVAQLCKDVNWLTENVWKYAA